MDNNQQQIEEVAKQIYAERNLPCPWDILPDSEQATYLWFAKKHLAKISAVEDKLIELSGSNDTLRTSNSELQSQVTITNNVMKLQSTTIEQLQSQVAVMREALKHIAAFRSTWSEDKIGSHAVSDNHGDIADAAYESFGNTVADIADKALQPPNQQGE